ncbi:MAG: hypothetical protein IJX65_05695 [Alistipes sp.]|nr:hypothetical protein [Alistipes sp.]
MKKIFGLVLLCTAVLCFNSCSAPLLTLKSSYPISNSVETNTPYDAVWANVIDFFAMNNLPIGVLEKDSGIIVANAVNIGESLVTMEDEYGKLQNDNAWFVLPYLNKYNGCKCVGNKATCSFNVRVRKVDDTKTSISVNLGGMQGIRILEILNTLTFKKYLQEIPAKEACVSTGKFERDLLNLFK